jgi:Helix-turn-helix domain
MNKPEETFYDILKVARKATVSEVVAAYHIAKNAFSKDSVATYSLFNPEEVQSVLVKLEEAYLTLSNIEKRVEYDRMLDLKAQNLDLPPSLSELEMKQNAQHLPRETPVYEGKLAGPLGDPNLPSMPDQLSGTILKEIREKRGMTIDDVSRITKIPSKFIRAIESDEPARLPARVYVQGFVKNLASLYRLDPQDAVKAYLAFLDQLTLPIV